MNKSISISIACYNDRETIIPLVGECRRTLEKHTPDFEVFVIDDGSSDGSGAALSDLAKSSPFLRVELHERNQGFGPTFSKLYKNNSKQINMILAGDAQIEPSVLDILLPHLDSADFIIGNRKIRKDNFRRRVASGFYNSLIRLASGAAVADVNSISIYETRHLDGVELNAVSAFIHGEFFLRLIKKGCRFKQVDIPHRERQAGVGSGGKPTVIINTIKEFFKYLRGGLG